MAEPFYVAGTGRACTELMRLAPGRIFAKTGAEGVFVAALRDALLRGECDFVRDIAAPLPMAVIGDMLGVLPDVNIVARTDHQDAIGLGQGVTEFNPKGQAAGEIRRLWTWIEKRTQVARHVKAA